MTSILPCYFVSNIANIFICLLEKVQKDNGSLTNQNESKPDQWFCQGGITLSFLISISAWRGLNMTSIHKLEYVSLPSYSLYKAQVRGMSRVLRAVISSKSLMKMKIWKNDCDENLMMRMTIIMIK